VTDPDTNECHVQCTTCGESFCPWHDEKCLTCNTTHPSAHWTFVDVGNGKRRCFAFPVIHGLAPHNPPMWVRRSPERAVFDPVSSPSAATEHERDRVMWEARQNAREARGAA